MTYCIVIVHRICVTVIPNRTMCIVLPRCDDQLVMDLRVVTLVVRVDACVYLRSSSEAR